MIYDKSTVYILGTAKIGKTDPIAALYDIFFVGVIIDRNNDEIVDTTCNMVRDVTSDFIKSIFIGYNVIDEIDLILNEISERFHGMAQKAVIAAIKDARNKYMVLIEKNKIK
jgi:hypothetical protein